MNLPTYLETRRVNRVLWIELVNPPVNFLSIDILAELYRLIKDADRDESLRVLVLTGGINDRTDRYGGGAKGLIDFPTLAQM